MSKSSVLTRWQLKHYGQVVYFCSPHGPNQWKCQLNVIQGGQGCPLGRGIRGNPLVENPGRRAIPSREGGGENQPSGGAEGLPSQGNDPSKPLVIPPSSQEVKLLEAKSDLSDVIQGGQGCPLGRGIRGSPLVENPGH